jgi:hypothetical protein
LKPYGSLIGFFIPCSRRVGAIGGRSWQIDIAAAAASIPANIDDLQLYLLHNFNPHSLAMGSGSSKPEGSQYVFAA